MDVPVDKRPTLRTLAEVTGLGVSTVSQALRNSPEIAEETRKRVQLAAQQAGYRPNRAGVRLRTGKTNVITVVLNPQDEGSGFFADFVFGISEGLDGTGYHLVVTPYSLSDPMAPVRYIVETQSADGVIFSRTQANDPRVRYLMDNNMPFATHGRTAMGIEHPFFDYDNERFAYEAVVSLRQKGRKRMALLSPPPELLYFQHTVLGFEKAVRGFGLDSFPLNAISIENSMAEIFETAKTLARAELRPDGIVCSSVAAAAFAAGYEAGGLKIGRDFDVVAKSSTQMIRILSPGVTYMSEDFRLAGRTLAGQVVRAIAGADVKEIQQVSMV